MTDQPLTERQQEYVRHLPIGSLSAWADKMGVSKSTVQTVVESLRDRDAVEYVDDVWRRRRVDPEPEPGVDADSPGEQGTPRDGSDAAESDGETDGDWRDTPVSDEEPDPNDLTRREEYLVRSLQTGSTIPELADDLDERHSIITEHLRDLRSQGWRVYHDDDADDVVIEGHEPLRSSEHKGTRTRKANRWWEKRHNELERQWRGLTPPSVERDAHPGREDWVTHLTDLHAGDIKRGYDDSVVHETKDLPPIIDHITERSLALADKHGSEYDTAYLLWGGDFVTNEGIYQGQFENLDAWLDEQMDILHDPLRRQIKAFSDEFDSVVVVGQAGNHGDIRANGSSKQANADLLLYKSIRNVIAALNEEGVCTNVEFEIGRAGSPTPFWLRDGEIHGQLRHGQDRKPQAETSARKKEWLTTVIDSMNFGQAVDLIWMGHYHVSGIVPWDGPRIMVTGSPLPVGEYPRKLGEYDAVNEPDIATCHGVSDDGMTGYYPIDPRNYDE